MRVMHCIRPTWTVAPASEPWRGQAQFRAHGTPVDAWFRPTDEGIDVEFDQPARGVAPGQTVVSYDGDRVVGSAVIASTEP